MSGGNEPEREALVEWLRGLAQSERICAASTPLPSDAEQAEADARRFDHAADLIAAAAFPAPEVPGEGVSSESAGPCTCGHGIDGHYMSLDPAWHVPHGRRLADSDPLMRQRDEEWADSLHRDGPLGEERNTPAELASLLEDPAREEAIALTDLHDGNLYCRDCGFRIGVTGIGRGICETYGCSLVWLEQFGARRRKPAAAPPAALPSDPEGVKG